MNSSASTFIDVNVMHIYLGEREFSTIPNDVPIDKWLYDKAWMRSYCSRVSTAKRKVGKVLGFFGKKIPVSPSILLAIALVTGAVYVQKIVNAPAKHSAPVVGTESKLYPIKRSKTLPPVILQEPTSTVENGLPAAVVEQVMQDPVKREVIEDKIKLVVARSSDEVQSKKVEKSVAETKKTSPTKSSVVTEKKPTLQDSMAKTNLPLPAGPTSSAQPRLLPPLPQFIAPTKTQSVDRPVNGTEKKVDSTGMHKSWMAIEDLNEEPKPVSASNVAAEPSVRQEEPKPKAPIKPTETVSEATPVVLQNYKIVTLTKNSVVIADPTTKTHRQIFVGAKMPGGETVKGVNEDAGTVTTDVRVLKMK